MWLCRCGRTPGAGVGALRLVGGGAPSPLGPGCPRRRKLSGESPAQYRDSHWDPAIQLSNEALHPGPLAVAQKHHCMELALATFPVSSYKLCPTGCPEKEVPVPFNPEDCKWKVRVSFSLRAQDQQAFSTVLRLKKHQTRPNVRCQQPSALQLQPPQELLVGSVTTVSGCREDDIVVESGACDLNGSYLDSFRSLFDNELCRTPYHVIGLSPSQLLSFRAKGSTGAAHVPGKASPNMEEHLAAMHEKLRCELPNFFLKTHDYGIYSQDVEFQNEILHLRTRGRTMYRAALTLCRFLAWNYFADLHMEVLKLTQHPENWTIQARWRVIGLPLHVLMLRFYKRDKSELYRTYDAYSTFYVGPDGLIYRHKVDKLMPAQPPVTRAKRFMAGLLVALGVAENRPALNCLLWHLAWRNDQKQ
uniref:Uncharacterized protein C6orf136 homolog n=1 Tax=Geotrypetes seraphini TaxID=260995 RepID=A0A6P8NQN1_GEOSA|nr:uncharacterized protein C6orf136 homolog [Geotrypetes seraphini]